jgi:hypothetical protein
MMDTYPTYAVTYLLDGVTKCDFGNCDCAASAVVINKGRNAVEVRPMCMTHKYWTGDVIVYV